MKIFVAICCLYLFDQIYIRIYGIFKWACKEKGNIWQNNRLDHIMKNKKPIGPNQSYQTNFNWLELVWLG